MLSYHMQYSSFDVIQKISHPARQGITRHHLATATNLPTLEPDRGELAITFKPRINRAEARYMIQQWLSLYWTRITPEGCRPVVSHRRQVTLISVERCPEGVDPMRDPTALTYMSSYVETPDIRVFSNRTQVKTFKAMIAKTSLLSWYTFRAHVAEPQPGHLQVTVRRYIKASNPWMTHNPSDPGPDFLALHDEADARLELFEVEHLRELGLTRSEALGYHRNAANGWLVDATSSPFGLAKLPEWYPVLSEAPDYADDVALQRHMKVRHQLVLPHWAVEAARPEMERISRRHMSWTYTVDLLPAARKALLAQADPRVMTTDEVETLLYTSFCKRSKNLMATPEREQTRKEMGTARTERWITFWLASISTMLTEEEFGYTRVPPALYDLWDRVPAYSPVVVVKAHKDTRIATLTPGAAALAVTQGMDAALATYHPADRDTVRRLVGMNWWNGSNYTLHDPRTHKRARPAPRVYPANLLPAPGTASTRMINWARDYLGDELPDPFTIDWHHLSATKRQAVTALYVITQGSAFDPQPAIDYVCNNRNKEQS